MIKIKDVNARRNLWLNFNDIISDDDVIDSVQIDPDSELTDLTVTDRGINNILVTDNGGNSYRTGTVVGVTVSGGVLMRAYNVVVRIVTGNGEIDDRSFKIMCVNR
jgi:hypothetical protein